jgi:CspA family cold shock protein
VQRDRRARRPAGRFAFSGELVHKVRADVASDGILASFRLLFLSTRYSRTARLIPAKPNDKKEKTMPIGTVKFFNSDKGYGFIQPEDGGSDAFVHISAVERAGMSTLNKEQRVTYELETDSRGRTSAVNLSAA